MILFEIVHNLRDMTTDMQIKTTPAGNFDVEKALKNISFDARRKNVEISTPFRRASNFRRPFDAKY